MSDANGWNQIRDSMRPRGLVVGLTSVLLSLVGSRLVAQISGTVRDRISGTPVPGAVVVGITSRDSNVARVLSDGAGRFTIPMTATQAVRLRVLRIGYQPATAVLNGLADVDVRLDRLPSLLDTVRRADRNDCSARGEAVRAVALWEQAQAALLAASLSREADPPAMRVVRFRRTTRQPNMSMFFQRHTPDISSQTVRTAEGLGTSVFGSSRSAGSVIAAGYMVRDSDGYVVYPPDDIVLLDESFVPSHCFHIEHDAAKHPGEIGVAFKPVADRGTMVGIQGTLWIDSVATALRVLEFSFTNLPVSKASRGPAGGLLTFGDAPNGTPLLIAWTMRQPGSLTQMYSERRGAGTMGYVARAEIEDGAELARAEWTNGDSWDAALPKIQGVVIDSKSGRPRLGIPVALLNAGVTALTDSNGHFSFVDLVHGPYILAVDDTLSTLFQDLVKSEAPRILWTRTPPSLIERPVPGDKKAPFVRLFNVALDSNPPITVELPPIEEAFIRWCSSTPQGDGDGILALWALSGRAVALKIPVTAWWQEGAAPVRRVVKTDDRGRAIICGVPRDRVIQVSIQGEQVDAAQSKVVFGPLTRVALVVLRK